MAETKLLAVWPQFLVDDVVKAAEFYRDKASLQHWSVHSRGDER